LELAKGVHGVDVKKKREGKLPVCRNLKGTWRGNTRVRREVSYFAAKKTGETHPLASKKKPPACPSDKGGGGEGCFGSPVEKAFSGGKRDRPATGKRGELASERIREVI